MNGGPYHATELAEAILTRITNCLFRSRTEESDHWVFQFGNGLVIHTDPFMRGDAARILPLGGPQDTILNRMLCCPALVRDRKVFEPFAGAGAFGLMSLKLGARHVEFLDINPRACAFQKDNATRNGFAAERYHCHLRSIVDYEAAEPFDVVLANPPFVPTPPGISGTLTSNGGAEGNDLAEALFLQLDGLLRPKGEAFVYLMQLTSTETPILAPSLPDALPDRTITFTPTQEVAISLDEYIAAYLHCFPRHEAEIQRWREDLSAKHRKPIGIQHYVVHVSSKRPGPSQWLIAFDLRESYGVEPYPAATNSELAVSRVMENVIPSNN